MTCVRFTDEEDARLLALRRAGLSWPQIAARMPGRMTGAVYERHRRLTRDPLPDWCPPTDADLYRKLVREGFSATDCERIIGDDMLVQARRRGVVV